MWNNASLEKLWKIPSFSSLFSITCCWILCLQNKLSSKYFSQSCLSVTLQLFRQHPQFDAEVWHFSKEILWLLKKRWFYFLQNRAWFVRQQFSLHTNKLWFRPLNTLYNTPRYAAHWTSRLKGAFDFCPYRNWKQYCSSVSVILFHSKYSPEKKICN